MRSENSSDLLDLEKGLPTSAEDITALRRARALSMSMDTPSYLIFLRSLPPQEPDRTIRPYPGLELEL